MKKGSRQGLALGQCTDLEIKHFDGSISVIPGELETCSHAPLGGEFVVHHYRGGKRINEYRFKNGITNQGKNLLLNVMFHGTSAIGTWYQGLISTSSFTALAAADTYGQIGGSNGWTEFTDYTDNANSNSAVTRPAWPEDAAASQAITNSSVVIFDVTGTGTVKGIFLCGGANAQTKSNATASGNYLWATALFNGGDVPVSSGDQLKVTYTVSA